MPPFETEHICFIIWNEIEVRLRKDNNNCFSLSPRLLWSALCAGMPMLWWQTLRSHHWTLHLSCWVSYYKLCTKTSHKSNNINFSCSKSQMQINNDIIVVQIHGHSLYIAVSKRLVWCRVQAPVCLSPKCPMWPNNRQMPLQGWAQGTSLRARLDTGSRF